MTVLHVIHCAMLTLKCLYGIFMKCRCSFTKRRQKKKTKYNLQSAVSFIARDRYHDNIIFVCLCHVMLQMKGNIISFTKTCDTRKHSFFILPAIHFTIVNKVNATAVTWIASKDSALVEFNYKIDRASKPKHREKMKRHRTL